MTSPTRTVSYGFTLIELISVITILGVLAAVALPRFVSLQTDARIAKLLAAQRAMQSAATMVHSRAQVAAGKPVFECLDEGGSAVGQEVSNEGAGYICAEGGLIGVLHFYPTPKGEGIIAAAGLDANHFEPSSSDLNNRGYGIATPSTSAIVLSVIGGPSTENNGAGSLPHNAHCAVTYRQPARNGAGPTFDIDQSDC